MRPSFKINNAIACEHLIQGQGNKHTLINIYAGDILVENFPARINLSLYFEIDPHVFGIIPLSIKVSYGRKIAMEGKADGVFEEGKVAIIAIPNGLMLFEKPDTLKVSIYADGERPITAIKKGIRLAEPGII